MSFRLSTFSSTVLSMGEAEDRCVPSPEPPATRPGNGWSTLGADRLRGVTGQLRDTVADPSMPY